MKSFLFISAALLTLAACSSSKTSDSAVEPEQSYQLITYVWSGGDVLPDPHSVDAINYAFAHVNSSRDGITIENEDHLREVVALRDINPDLKVLLAIGGGCSEGFTELAADSLKRLAFAADLRLTVDRFGLDGIDFDWEAPAFPDGTPEDVDNFELLLRDSRVALGDSSIISIAAMAGALGMKFPDILRYIDYVNLMVYDMTWTRPGSHTSMRESAVGGFDYNVERAMSTYAEKGVPPEKIMLGLAFYGRGDGHNFPEWHNYRDIVLGPGMEERWDSVGCVPYIVDSLGNFALGYEDPRSLAIKCDYIKTHGLRGAMIWRYELDDDSLTLMRTVTRELLGH